MKIRAQDPLFILYQIPFDRAANDDRLRRNDT